MSIVEKAHLTLVGHNTGLDDIKRRIEEGHERLEKGHDEWVEGSLQIAVALREGRDRHSSDIEFGQWLKNNKLDYFGANPRVALIKLAKCPDLAREILSKTESRSYQLIWREARGRFTSASKPTTAQRSKSRKHGNIKALNRAKKLGPDVVASLEGTSLASAQEQDELVVLNRGAELGKLTDDVCRLVEDAKAGKVVSAIAYSAELKGRKRPTLKQVTDAFKLRMTFIWKQADTPVREAFIEYLIEDSKDE